MTSVTEVLKAVARHLHEAGRGVYLEDPLAVYPEGATAITLKQTPANPDRVICLNMYGGEDALLPYSTPALQVRTRGLGFQPLDVDEMADGVFRSLQLTRYLPAGEGSISGITRSSWVPLGADGSDRWERSDNYRVLMSSYTDNRPKRN